MRYAVTWIDDRGRKNVAHAQFPDFESVGNWFRLRCPNVERYTIMCEDAEDTPRECGKKKAYLLPSLLAWATTATVASILLLIF